MLRDPGKARSTAARGRGELRVGEFDARCVHIEQDRRRRACRTQRSVARYPTSSMPPSAHRAVRVTAAADAHERGVARAQLDGFHRHAEMMRDHLRERGFVSLAGRLRARHDIDAAVGAHRQFDAFTRRAHRRSRCSSPSADAAQPPRRARRLARRSAKLSHCASVSARAMLRAKSPLSYVRPIGLRYGSLSRGTRLRRRISARSIPKPAAARSSMPFDHVRTLRGGPRRDTAPWARCWSGPRSHARRPPVRRRRSS